MAERGSFLWSGKVQERSKDGPVQFWPRLPRTKQVQIMLIELLRPLASLLRQAQSAPVRTLTRLDDCEG